MSVRHQPGGHPNGLRSERGSAAMLAAVGMALLLVVTVSIVSLAQLETKIGVNRAQEVRAIQAAEAGARRVYREMGDSGIGPATWLTQGGWPNPYYSNVAVGSGGTATYSVWIRDNDNTPTTDADNILAVRSTGVSGGTARTVTLLVQPGTAFAPTDAIRIKGHVKIPGSPIVQGACGSVHVPDAGGAGIEIDVSGSPVIQQGMSTNGQIDSGQGYYHSAYPIPSGTQQEAVTIGVPGRAVPTIDPTKYGKYADYILNSNGYAYKYDPSASGRADPGTFCTSKTTACGAPSGWILIDKDDGGGAYTVGECVKGWKRQAGPASNGPAVWVDCGGASPPPVPGTYYIKGAMKMSNSPGTSANPLHLTVITEAYIDISGSPTVVWDNLTTTSTPVASLNPNVPKDILFVAGTDINFAGSVGEYVQGVIMAHEQIGISGSGTLNGVMMAEDTCNGVNSYPTCDGHVTDNSMSGSPHVNYDCGLQPAELGSPPVVTKWMTE